MEEKKIKMKDLSEEIHEKKERLHHYMNLEVDAMMLYDLREDIKEKQAKLLEMIGEENESNNKK